MEQHVTCHGRSDGSTVIAATGAITVFLADDNLIVREGVRALFEFEDDLEDQLARAVREVASGGSVLDDTIVEALTTDLRDDNDLSADEEDLLGQVAAGRSRRLRSRAGPRRRDRRVGRYGAHVRHPRLLDARRAHRPVAAGASAQRASRRDEPRRAW